MSIEYTKDVAEIPPHFNLDFFQEITESALRNSHLELQKINITMGSSPGENYCSEIYRVRIQYKLLDSSAPKELSVIIKVIPVKAAVEFLQDLRVFLKEKVTYYEVLPRMEIMLEKPTKFGPRMYHCLKTPINSLVFEDLGSRNYEMASRETGLDETHCQMVMTKLAQFHAASMVFAKKDPEIIKSYNWGMLAPHAMAVKEGMLYKFFAGHAEALVDVVSQWPGFEVITEKLRKYEANLGDNLVRSQEPLAGEIKVLNHGDLWVNNMLFKYDRQRRVEDVAFIDFQLSIWGSPGIDLNYFFYTSLTFDMLKNKREQLLKVYHKELCATLSTLNYPAVKVPSLAEILQEVRRREGYGLMANYSILPLVAFDKAECADNTLENFSDDNFMKKKTRQMFASKRLEETLRYTLKRFDEMGILDN